MPAARPGLQGACPASHQAVAALVGGPYQWALKAILHPAGPGSCFGTVLTYFATCNPAPNSFSAFTADLPGRKRAGAGAHAAVQAGPCPRRLAASPHQPVAQVRTLGRVLPEMCHLVLPRWLRVMDRSRMPRGSACPLPPPLWLGLRACNPCAPPTPTPTPTRRTCRLCEGGAIGALEGAGALQELELCEVLGSSSEELDNTIRRLTNLHRLHVRQGGGQCPGRAGQGRGGVQLCQRRRSSTVSVAQTPAAGHAPPPSCAADGWCCDAPSHRRHTLASLSAPAQAHVGISKTSPLPALLLLV